MLKKNDKSLLQAQKRYLQEALVKLEHSEREKFYYIVCCLLLDQGLIFALAYDDKALSAIGHSVSGILYQA